MKALSLDINKILNADEADKLRNDDGIAISKFNFQCTDTNCDAQITCANLDKPRNERKRDPYFKYVGEHSDSCLIAQEFKKSIDQISYSDNGYNQSDKIIEGIFRLNLSTPTKKLLESDSINDESINIRKRVTNHSNKRGQRDIKRSKTLDSLITLFLNGENPNIQLPGNEILPLKELFIEINGQNIKDLHDGFRIYYGRAWINQKDEQSYIIKFTNHLIYKELIKNPSFFINKTHFDSYTYKKLSTNKIQTLISSKPKMIFILSDITPYPSHNEKYINLKLDTLDYFNYR